MIDHHPARRRLSRLFAELILVLLALALSGPMATEAAGTLTVNSGGDTNEKDDFLTLREAILISEGMLNGSFSNEEAAQIAGCTFNGADNNWMIVDGCGAGIPDTITFDDHLTITLNGLLPPMADEGTVVVAQSGQVVAVDGAGVAANLFEITGSNMRLDGLHLFGATDVAVWITGVAEGVTIANSIIGSEAAANAADGVLIGGGTEHTVSNNTIHHNERGVLIAGSESNHLFGNIIENNSNQGVRIDNGAQLNVIGCGPGDANDGTHRNLIRSNGDEGILISGAGTSGNLVLCNWIGLSDDGASAAPNGSNGIRIDSQASDNRIGATQAQANVISGNDAEGIRINDADENLILGNFIGTNATGDKAVPNRFGGIFLFFGAGGNLIGEAGSHDTGNVISGNDGDGIYLLDAGDENKINSNLIGLAADGHTGLGNALNGIHISQSSDNNEIGATLGSYQYIAANGVHGVRIADSNGNRVDVTNIIRDNAGAGVLVEDAEETAIYNSVITDNGGAGVAVTGTSRVNIGVGVFMGNAGLPIDLGDDGHTPNDGNDADDGPNGLLNYPVITSVENGHVRGSSCASCIVYIYEAVGDPSRARGGGNALAFALANAAGEWSYELPADLTRVSLSLIAVDGAGNTSEMSPRPVTLAPVVLADE